MKENKQAIRSKNWMVESLLELMEKMPFNAISISNIVEKADVARLTFYRNFKSKEDIILYKGTQINNKINSRLDELKTDSKEDIFRVIIDQVLENKIFFNAVVKNDLDNLIVKLFRDEISDLFRVIFDDADEYRISFYVGGFSSVILDWFKSNSKDDLYKVVLRLL